MGLKAWVEQSDVKLAGRSGGQILTVRKGCAYDGCQ